jgi:hypothetical protein
MDLREIGSGVWSGFTLLRIGTVGGLLWMRWWTFWLWRQGVSYLIIFSKWDRVQRSCSLAMYLFNYHHKYFHCSQQLNGLYERANFPSLSVCNIQTYSYRWMFLYSSQFGYIEFVGHEHIINLSTGNRNIGKCLYTDLWMILPLTVTTEEH